LVVFALLASRSADVPVAKETPLMSRALPDLPGREGLVERIVLAPGEVVPAHRHDADVFAYVLEGSIITRVQGGEPQTVHAGEVFYESPTDLHLRSRNASTKEPVTLLVFFVKKMETPHFYVLPWGSLAGLPSEIVLASGTFMNSPIS
jgi:quercetin dioxygenase-like cupin family protein